MADYIRPTPRNPILGLLADALTGGVDWMRDPRRAQQMQGLGGLLAETGIPATMERLSYGELLTKGRGMTTRLRPEAEAALMTLGPEAVPIGRGAMAGVRATKGLPVGAATVYHGSPYRFQRFDPTKIGSGEGAQAYGYGHYVAESPGVAKSYQEALSGYSADGKRLPGNIGTVVSNFGGDVNAAIADRERQLTNWLATNPDKKNFVVKDLQDEIKKLQALKGKSLESTGALYTIDLPDPAIARMLDWDKPLSEQPESVRAAAMDLGLPKNATGKDIYNALANSARDAAIARGNNAGTTLSASQAGASADLRGFGIPGIRYLDQGSRSNFRVQNTYKGAPYGEPVSFMTEKQAKDYAAGQIEKGFGTNILPGTSNFVVFPGEEDLLRILSVDGGLLGR